MSSEQLCTTTATVMVLAAGRGERMRPLTDHCPKPLLTAAGKTLIDWQIDKLIAGGFRRFVINHAYLGAQIEAHLGDGADRGVSFIYSPETAGALETAGGIRWALDKITMGSANPAAPFMVVNGDVFSDSDYGAFFCRYAPKLAPGEAALLMTDNPAHHAEGDFCLSAGRLRLANDGTDSAISDNPVGKQKTCTYNGTAVFTPAFFQSLTLGTALKLRPLLEAAIREQRLYAHHDPAYWLDVGTPERLAELDRRLRAAR